MVHCSIEHHFKNEHGPTLPTRVLFCLIFSMAALRPARRFSCQEQQHSALLRVTVTGPF